MDDYAALKVLALEKGWTVNGGATGEIDLVSPCRRFFKKFAFSTEDQACTLALNWLQTEAETSLEKLATQRKKRRKNATNKSQKTT
jgi:hypothetical protein